MKNQLRDIPADVPFELIETLVEARTCRIERIVSRGHASSDDRWYNQDEHEFVVVLKGSARLQFEDALVELEPGDFVAIPAHRRHRVEWTSPEGLTIWLAVFYK